MLKKSGKPSGHAPINEKDLIVKIGGFLAKKGEEGLSRNHKKIQGLDASKMIRGRTKSQ